MADFSGSYDIFQMEIQDEPIQKSIDAIRPGGSIYLKEGVYKGPVTIDMSVNIFGADSGETFIDGNQQGSVFTIGKTDPNIDGELSTISISGGSSEYGGGIKNFGRLRLFDVIINGNTASQYGGGVFNHGSIICATAGIFDNSAKVGAGIFNDLDSNLDLNAVIIKSNTAAVWGGGILNVGNMVFRGGTVYGNEPDDIIDATIHHAAGDLGSPAVNSGGSSCGTTQ